MQDTQERLLGPYFVPKRHHVYRKKIAIDTLDKPLGNDSILEDVVLKELDDSLEEDSSSP